MNRADMMGEIEMVSLRKNRLCGEETLFYVLLLCLMSCGTTPNKHHDFRASILKSVDQEKMNRAAAKAREYYFHNAQLFVSRNDPIDIEKYTLKWTRVGDVSIPSIWNNLYSFDFDENGDFWQFNNHQLDKAYDNETTHSLDLISADHSENSEQCFLRGADNLMEKLGLNRTYKRMGYYTRDSGKPAVVIRYTRFEGNIEHADENITIYIDKHTGGLICFQFDKTTGFVDYRVKISKQFAENRAIKYARRYVRGKYGQLVVTATPIKVWLQVRTNMYISRGKFMAPRILCYRCYILVVCKYKDSFEPDYRLCGVNIGAANGKQIMEIRDNRLKGANGINYETLW